MFSLANGFKTNTHKNNTKRKLYDMHENLNIIFVDGNKHIIYKTKADIVSLKITVSLKWR